MTGTLMHPMCAKENRRHSVGAHIFYRLSRDCMGEQTIHHQSAANTYREENARICTACAHRIDQVSLCENDRLSGKKIRCSDRQGNAQLFKGLHLQDAVQKAGHAVVRAETKSGNRVAGKIFEADDGGDLFELLGRHAAAIGCADDRAYACARDEVGDDPFLFEYFQNADMSEVACESSAEGKSNATWLGSINAGLMR